MSNFSDWLIDWLVDLLIDLLKDEDASVCSSGYSSEAESEEASIIYYKVGTIYNISNYQAGYLSLLSLTAKS